MYGGGKNGDRSVGINWSHGQHYRSTVFYLTSWSFEFDGKVITLVRTSPDPDTGDNPMLDVNLYTIQLA